MLILCFSLMGNKLKFCGCIDNNQTTGCAGSPNPDDIKCAGFVLFLLFLL